MTSMLPGGDKLPKIKSKEYDLDVTLTAVIGGVAIAKLGDMEALGYIVAGVGSISTLIEARRLLNPYKALFDNLNMKVGDQIPRYIKKNKTNYGYCLTFSLPYGMSTDDFEKKKLAIEQYLNKRIEINYNNYRVFIKVFDVGLEKLNYKFIPTKNMCEFPIGVTYGGKIVTVDLEQVVHLLIAGETGSGKSVLLRGIITHLILNNNKLMLHLIDLKNGAELNVFKNSKMVKTFSRTIEEAEKVLNNLVLEVEHRYDLFYENNVVDIKEYNKLKGLKKLDYSIVIIDEFADLQDEKGSISSIERLTQKARVAGVHCIIATQRPDAKILNGRIKSNVPAVVGLKTMNELNSRIIIDSPGLELLKGKGNGLLKHADITEFQSMFLSVQDTRELIKDTYIDKTKKTAVTQEPVINGVLKDISFIKNMR